MTEEYINKFQEGLEYQDFVIQRLCQGGIVLSAYSSRSFQNSNGETVQGVEIKLDKRFKETGNLYFEVSEKSSPDKPNYTPSGIFREDNTWLYLIGDREQAYMFTINMLRQLYSQRSYWQRYGIEEKQTPTSTGFILPVENIKPWMIANHFKFER